jgi:predicted nuclease with TOPRIM domain
LPTKKLQAFYDSLAGEDRCRFHYVANVCLGFESWSRLYQELVVQETQARLTGRLEEAYAHRTKELRRREEELQVERGGLEDEVMRLDRDNLALTRENQHLKDDLANLQQAVATLQGQQQQLLDLVERYKLLLQEARQLMSPAGTSEFSEKFTA